MKTILIIFLALESFHAMRKIDCGYQLKVRHSSKVIFALDSMVFAMAAFYIWKM